MCHKACQKEFKQKIIDMTNNTVAKFKLDDNKFRHMYIMCKEKNFKTINIETFFGEQDENEIGNILARLDDGEAFEWAKKMDSNLIWMRDMT